MTSSPRNALPGPRHFPAALFATLLLAAPPARAILDTNGNGLSDIWGERKYNNGQILPPTYPPEAAECAAGTNPFVNESAGGVFRLNIIPNDNAGSGPGNDPFPDALTWWTDKDKPNLNIAALHENWHIENGADAMDVAPVRLSLPALPPGTRVFLTLAETEDLHAIHIFRKREAGQIAIWGGYSTAGIPWKDTDSNPLDMEITSWLAPSSGSGGIPGGVHTLGVEGLLLRGMPVPGGSMPGAPGKFSGMVEIGRVDTPEKQLRAVFFSRNTLPPMVAKVWKTNFAKDNRVVITDQDYDAVKDDWARITANGGGILRLVGGPGGGQVADISNIRKAVQTDANKLEGNPDPTGKLLIEVSRIYQYEAGWQPFKDWKGVVKRSDNAWFSRPTENTELVCVERSLGWGVGKPALITVQEVLADAEFVAFNETTVQQKIAETLATCDITDPVRVPCLFYYYETRQEERDSVNGRDFWYAPAFTPNPANLQWVDGAAFHPKPFGPRDTNGADVFEEAIRAAFGASNSDFLDVWENSHLKQGEVHCGTAAKRTPAASWWSR